MILPIVRYNDPILRRKGEKVGAITPQIRKLALDMLETSRAKGIGLAAQQVGHALQLAVIDLSIIDEEKDGRVSKMWIGGKVVDHMQLQPIFLIDPEISGTKTKETGVEGCLSFPGLSLEITRSARVKVKTRTLEGEPLEFEATGLLAKAVQHEYDHLQGKLFIDHIAPATRKKINPILEMICSNKSAQEVADAMHDILGGL
jgi:peptide deformylase